MTDYLMCIPFFLVASLACWAACRNWRHGPAATMALICAFFAALEGLSSFSFPAIVWYVVSIAFWFVIPLWMLVVQFGMPKYSLSGLVLLVTGSAVGLFFNSSLLIGDDITTFGFPVACIQFNTGYSAIAGDDQGSRARLRESLSLEQRRISKIELYVPMVANAGIWFWTTALVALAARRIRFLRHLIPAFVHRTRRQRSDREVRGDLMARIATISHGT